MLYPSSHWPHLFIGYFVCLNVLWKCLSVHHPHKTMSMCLFRFTGRDEILSASTDGSLRLWAMSPRDATDQQHLTCNHPHHAGILEPHNLADPMHIQSINCQPGECRSRLSPFRGTLARTFQGHTNERNFVGLAVDGDLIACGSETNQVGR